MSIRTFPVTAGDDSIRELVAEWSECLAEQKYEAALNMFLHSDTEAHWNPALLERVIAGYGVADPDEETLASMLQDWGVAKFEITTVFNGADKVEEMKRRIDVDREHLYGLNPATYVGMVHYNDVPLCGSRSDLTARFHIKRLMSETLTLEFLDLHVM